MTIDERPYGQEDPTSGWSLDTSESRARGQDAEGTTADRQTRTVAELGRYGNEGLTWKELASLTGWHHGQASGVLSVLHKTGHVARLAETRGRCKVYVLPEYVRGRDVERHGVDHDGDAGDDRAALLAVVDHWFAPSAAGMSRADWQPAAAIAAVKAAYAGEPPPPVGASLF